jgi:iron complex transport system substrate-binding protein
MFKKLYRLVLLFLLGILVVVTISACSKNGDTSTKPNSSSSTETCRVIQHAMGETCVPNAPQRIIDLAGLDYALGLGVQPIASNGVYDLSLYLPEAAEAIEDVGGNDAPSLERILELKPDLIVGGSYADLNYNLLSDIAPTVILSYDYGGQWKDYLRQYAAALGKTETAEQVISRYHERVEEFQQQMGERPAEIDVSIVRVYPTHINFYLKDSFCGAIVADAGLSRPSSQNFTASEANTLFSNPIQYQVSQEKIPDADGDAIFLWTYGHLDEIAQQAQSAKEKLKADPLWSTLTAVQQDKVYEVPGEYWIGEGPIAANLVLDDLFKYLIKK